jgi:hypothetical protein
MDMKKRFFTCILFLCALLQGDAQSIKRLGASTGYGSIIAHAADLLPISQTNPWGFSGSFQFMGTQKKDWETCNCYYYLGLKFSYENFGNPQVLGSSTGISGTFEPILWQKDPWVLSLQSGIGFSYLNKVFHPIDNPNNLFFSAPVSFLVFVAPALEYRFAPRWAGQVSFTYNHISNGGQSQPNKGMNYPMLGIGLNHYYHPKELPEYTSDGISQQWKYFMEASYTNKESVWSPERKPVFTLAAGAFKPLTSFNALGGGVELTKDYTLAVEESRWEALMPAPFISHHFLLGRIEFSQRMAFYAHKPFGYNEHLFYQRYILQYRAWSDLSLGMGLKVHGHVAENIDFRLGWRF